MFSPRFRIDSSKHLLAKELLRAMDQVGQGKTIDKGKLVIGTGPGNDFFFLVNKGCFKTYRQIDQREYIVGFTFPGDVDGDPSIFHNAVSDFLIQAVVKSEVTVCRWTALESFLREKDYLLTVNFFLAQYVSVLQNRLIDSIAVTAEERYKNLIRLYAKDLDQVPIADLARYLGITQQSMSRIRSAKF